MHIPLAELIEDIIAVEGFAVSEKVFLLERKVGSITEFRLMLDTKPEILTVPAMMVTRLLLHPQKSPDGYDLLMNDFARGVSIAVEKHKLLLS